LEEHTASIFRLEVTKIDERCIIYATVGRVTRNGNVKSCKSEAAEALLRILMRTIDVSGTISSSPMRMTDGHTPFSGH
jgi:hypothetical protein